MQSAPSLVDLERRLSDARARAAGTAEELAALVELATRLVSDPDRRGKLARDGAQLAAQLGAEVPRLRCRAMIAEFVARRQRPAEALPDALDTLADAQRVADPQALAQAHHTVAHCFDALDCTAEALEHVYQATDAYRRAGDRFGEARMLSFMGAILAQFGEGDRARELYERAHEVFVDCGDPSGAGVMLSCVARILRGGGDADGAARVCERALDHFERAGMPLDAYMAMLAYAEVLTDLGRRDLAKLWVKRAMERNRLPSGTLANPSYEIEILVRGSGRIQLAEGDLPGAQATLERAVALADGLGALRQAASAEAMLAETLYTAGELAPAYEHLRRSRHLADALAQAAHDRRVRALRVRFEVEQARREALRYRDQAHAQAEVIAELERTKAELATRIADLQRLNAEVVELSQTDPLTAIANRRFMTERLVEYADAAARYGTPLAVAVFDVDRFKDINDAYGHEVGDAVLVTLTNLVRGQLRSCDLPARLGGDEFVIIMPGTNVDDAVAACARLQVAVREYPWETVAPQLAVTITIGVAEGSGRSNPEEILRSADGALYHGKHSGRDTVSCAPAVG